MLAVPKLKVLRRGYGGRMSETCLMSVITQLSIDRLDKLRQLCACFATVQCHIIAAILNEDRNENVVLSKSKTNEVLSSLEEMVSTLPNTSLQTIVAEVVDWRNDTLYPINALRNLALEAAGTEFVFILDVDCMPTTGALDALMGTAEKLSALRALCWEESSAIVVPCFEVSSDGTGSGEHADMRSVFTATELYEEAFRDGGGKVQPFMGKRFDRGHRATNYAYLKQVWNDRLRGMPVVESSPATRFPPCFYPIEYEEGYEPYVIMCRAYVCPYDAAFSGYGRNKALHLYHLQRLGVRFVGCADIALLHIDHAPTSDRVRLLGAADDEAAGNCTDNKGSPRAGLQLGLLRDIKAMYAESRMAITTHCASWALENEGLHEPPPPEPVDPCDADQQPDKDLEIANSGPGCGLTCMPSFWARGSRSRIQVPLPSVQRRRFCAGTATAWLPAEIQKICSALLRAHSQSADTPVEDDEGLDLEDAESSRPLLRVLTHLCSIHMHYEAPVLHTQRIYYASGSQTSQPSSSRPVVWLVTHLSVDRLEKLAALCRCWRGPVAAAVWIQPYLTRAQRAASLSAIQTLVEDVRRNTNGEFRCTLHLIKAENEFVEGWLGRVTPNPRVNINRQELHGAEFIPPRQSALSSKLYPVNALRAAAMDIVLDHYTEKAGAPALGSAHVMAFLVDVDMRPSDLVAAALAEESSLQRTIADACREGKFVVFPALEVVTCDGRAADASLAIQALLHAEHADALGEVFTRLCATSSVRAFHASTYPAGHKCTDTAAWLAIAPEPGICPTRPILRNVQHEEGWEPYGIMSLNAYVQAGGINRCFVGWHKDKIDFIQRLQAHGTEFCVCEDRRAFVLDWQPHGLTSDRVRTGVDLMYLAAMQGLYERSCRQLQARTELSAEEAYSSDARALPLSSAANTAGELLQDLPVSLTRADDLPILLRASESGMSFWRTDGTVKVRASEEGRANITAGENAGAFVVKLKSASLTPPMGGISFLMEPTGAEWGGLAVRYAVRFPADFSWSCLGCLPGLTGKLCPQENEETNSPITEEGMVECRGRWTKQGLLQISVSAILSGVATKLIEMCGARRVQLHRQVWHEVEMVAVTSGVLSVRIDGALIYAARFPEVYVLQSPAVRMCLFVVDNSTVADSSIEIRNVCITGERDAVTMAQSNKLLPTPPSPAAEAVPRSQCRPDIERMIETETTVIFAPKEVHSLGALCLRVFLELYPVVAHLIVVIAPPIPAPCEAELRAVLAEHPALRVTLHVASPFQNPYELRNSIVEQCAVRTKYTLHLNNDVFPHRRTVSTADAEATRGKNSGGARVKTWLEELVAYAEDNPQHWAVMPLLLEKNSHRYGLHVWWDITAVQKPDPSSTDEGRGLFYAKFDNDALLVPVESLPSHLATKLAEKPLLFLEDHCVLARTAHFSSAQPLFDPRACYRREFFDLAWQIRARGGDVGMALQSVVVYEKVQPLQLEDLPYFLHRRQDELCFMSQEYLAHKWRIKYRTDCWHETQRSDALRGIYLCNIPAYFHTTLTLVASFLAMVGANRFCLTDEREISPVAAGWCNMEDLLAGGFPSAPERLVLCFRQVRAAEILFKSPPDQVSLAHLRGIERMPCSDAHRLNYPAENSAYTNYAIVRLTVSLPACDGLLTAGDIMASGTLVQVLEQGCWQLLDLCSLVIQFGELTLEAYLWIKEDIADEKALLTALRTRFCQAVHGSTYQCTAEHASEVTLSRGAAGKIVRWRYSPTTVEQISNCCVL